MIIIRRGRWSHAAERWFTYDRLYWRGRWTPFCRVSWRHGWLKSNW